MGFEGAECGVVDRIELGVVGDRGADDPARAAVRGLAHDRVEPPCAQVLVDEHDLPLHIAEGVEVGGGAGLRIHQWCGDAGGRRGLGAGEGGGGEDAVADGEAGVAELVGVDGHRFEADVCEAHGAHLGGDAFAGGVLGGRTGETEAELGVCAERAEEGLELLGILFGEEPVDGLLDGGGGEIGRRCRSDWLGGEEAGGEGEAARERAQSRKGRVFHGLAVVGGA